MSSLPSLPDVPDDLRPPPEGEFPFDARLRRVAEELARTRWAALICDEQWRLQWVSDELKALLGEDDEGKLGYGLHLVECWMRDAWFNAITPQSQVASFVCEVPYMLYDTPGGGEEIARILFERVGGLSDDFGVTDPLQLTVEPKKPPPLWSDSFDFLQGDLPPAPIKYVCCRLRDDTGKLIGMALIYGPGLPARVLALVARGDEDMYRRMSRLINPGRRQAAILFADLDSSGVLSRKLPSATYFALIRELTTAIDEVVIGHTGIVGKHAGDGVTAFFLSDDLGTPSRAARAAIASAREISQAAESVARSIAGDSGLFGISECAVNVGTHWGGTLYMGQVVTGGRLEVTALGDAVTECARIQETASGGIVLASKSVVEHLDDDDARALGLETDTLLYRTVAEIAEASSKAVRDAGSIPVTQL